MGMYTQIHTNLKLNENTPNDVISALKMMVGEIEIDKHKLPNHPLFETPRWDFMLLCSSFYFTPFNVTKLEYNDISQRYYLVSFSDFKNYDNEVDLFFNFITPYVQSGLIGYSQYEEDDYPTYHYNIEGKHIKVKVDSSLFDLGLI